MVAGKLKSLDSRSKIPRDSKVKWLCRSKPWILAAMCMLFLFGMELRSFLTVDTFSSVIVDTSPYGEFLRVQLNISFPELPCQFAYVDVSDVLGTNHLNLKRALEKFPIDQTNGSKFHFKSTHNQKHSKREDDSGEDIGEGSISLSLDNFYHYSHEYPILVVKFYAPWCHYSKKLAPAWEKAAKIIRERYDPVMDGRILIGEVDCVEQTELCRRSRIDGYPSIRVFRDGSDVRLEDGREVHQSYYGNRNVESLVAMMESLVAHVTGGCRIEGFLHVKKVPGDLIISARSASNSFDATKMNISHAVSHLSFGDLINAKLLSDMKRWSPYIGASHNRLDGKAFITPHDAKENVTIEHYIQVVKTKLVSKRVLKDELLLEEYGYTAQSSIAQSPLSPVAKFHMEFSPMQVLIEEKPKFNFKAYY